MSRYHQRPAFLQIGGDGYLNNTIESRNHALNISAPLHVDDRVAIGHEDIAGADHVRAPKEDHGIAVGMRRRLVNHSDSLTVEEKYSLGSREGVCGPSALRRRVFSARLAHSVKNRLKGDHFGLISS